MIVYKYDVQTKEFLQDLEINEAYGTNLPFTTTVKPLTKKDGFAVCFNGTKWEYIEDNRNTVVYNKETKQESKIDYLGVIKEDVTTLKPEQFDKLDYKTNQWVLDSNSKKAYEQAQFRVERNQLLIEADIEINKLDDLNMDSSSWRAYRQALRDSTESWVLPTKPEGGN